MANSSFQELKVVLTATQILSMHTNPVLLIAGVSECVIDINSIYFRYLHGSTPFNPAESDVIYVANGVVPDVLIPFDTTIATGFVDQTVDMSVWNSSLAGAVPLSYILGKGIYLYQGTGTGGSGSNWTQGNGELAVFIKYAYVEIP